MANYRDKFIFTSKFVGIYHMFTTATPNASHGKNAPPQKKVLTHSENISILHAIVLCQRFNVLLLPLV